MNKKMEISQSSHFCATACDSLALVSLGVIRLYGIALFGLFCDTGTIFIFANIFPITMCELENVKAHISL